VVLRHFQYADERFAPERYTMATIRKACLRIAEWRHDVFRARQCLYEGAFELFHPSVLQDVSHPLSGQPDPQVLLVL
jgi:hypothetical protein